MAKQETDRSRYWRGVLAEWEKSGLSQVAFCRQRQLSLSALRWWRGKFLKEGEKATRKRQSRKGRFVPVRVVESSSAAEAEVGGGEGSAVEVLLGHGRSVRVRSGFNPEVLRRVIAVLEADGC